jgi:hypothetical protein
MPFLIIDQKSTKVNKLHITVLEKQRQTNGNVKNVNGFLGRLSN